MKPQLLFLMLALIVLSGCAAGTQQLYDWKNYSHSLYKAKKEPTPDNVAGHKECLVAIIVSADEQGRRVPPGICAELGYLLAHEGKQQEAEQYYSREAEIYPESKQLIVMLKNSSAGKK